jgi:predicted nucleic acid-binding protein
LELPNWIKIKEVKDKKFQHLLETQLDKGESSAIALAMETENPLIIIDENKARQFAKKLDLRITGTLGILIYAKNKGVIKDIEPIITKLLATDFRISKKLVDLMLELNIDLM